MAGLLDYGRMANGLLGMVTPVVDNPLGRRNAVNPLMGLEGAGGPRQGGGGNTYRAYHHTNSDFESFRPGSPGQDRQAAVWFSPTPNTFNNMHQFWRGLREGRAYDARGNTISKQAIEMFEGGKLGSQQHAAIRARMDEAAKSGNISGSKVIPADVTMKNPAIFRGDKAGGGSQGARHDITLLSPSKVAELKSKGFDGAIAYNKDGSIYELAAFTPGSVKSAITGKTLFNLGAGLSLGDVLLGALDRKEPQPPM